MGLCRSQNVEQRLPKERRSGEKPPADQMENILWPSTHENTHVSHRGTPKHFPNCCNVPRLGQCEVFGDSNRFRSSVFEHFLTKPPHAYSFRKTREEVAKDEELS